jgi:hypothetical protein
MQGRGGRNGGKGETFGPACTLYSRVRWWSKAVQRRRPWAAKWRWRQRSGRHQCVLGTDVRTGSLTGGSHAVSLFCTNYQKPIENCKFKMDTLWYSKNSKILHEAILGCSEELSCLCRLQIPYRTYVKNHGTDSILNLL